MRRYKILIINFVILLNSSVKSLTESTNNNKSNSDAIKPTQSGLDNSRKSITIYITNDDILSISEFNKLYNPEERYFVDLQFDKETDSDYVNKVSPKNNNSKIIKPKVYYESNIINRNDDSTTIDNKEAKEDSNLEDFITPTNEVASTTIGIKDEGKSADFIEGYNDEFYTPENSGSTEKYFESFAFNDETNNDNIVAPIISRFFSQSDKGILENNGRTTPKLVESADVDQDTLPKQEVMNFKKLYEQSNAETPVASQLIYPHSVISQQQLHNLSPQISFRRNLPADLREITNQDSSNLVLAKMAPDEYEQRNNLDKSKKILIVKKTIDDFNTNIYENPYPYTTPNNKKNSQQRLINYHSFNNLYSKLSQASEHPLKNKIIRENIGVYGYYYPNIYLQNRYLPNFRSYNFRPITRRVLACDNCAHQYKTGMN